MIDFYNADCLPAMKKYPHKHFDLAIVDPPYGINATKMSMGTNLKRSKNGYSGESTATRLRKGRLNQGPGKLKNRALNTLNCDWDFSPPSDEYFAELFRISKNQIIFGGNYFNLPPTRGIFVWDKVQPWYNFSQIELAWTSFDCTAKIFRFSNRGGRNEEKRICATQKPIELYEWILRNYAKSGDLILDTHVGSGSSLIAYDLHGHNCVGYELDKEQFERTSLRLERHKSQIRFEL